MITILDGYKKQEVNMAAFWMCELAPTEVSGTDACNRDQMSGRRAKTRDRKQAVEQSPAGSRMLRVLVVDDDQDTTDGLVRLVRRWGHTARMAYDGAGALRVAADQRPDVVLLDIAMPIMDGYALARQLRRDFPDGEMFIVAVTGFGDSSCRQDREGTGIDLVLIKPVDSETMETLLMLEYQRVNRQVGELGSFRAIGPRADHEDDSLKQGGGVGRTSLPA